MGKESKLEKDVSAFARRKGCYVRKFKSPNQRGVPDKLFLTPFGKVFFIEFKSPNKKPTELQKREIREIISRKGNAFVVDNYDQGVEIVKSFLA